MDKATLLSYMPGYYKTSQVIDNLNNANALELDGFTQKLENITNQFFLDSADFTLERWEKEFGIEVNNGYDTEYRRSRIRSKKRGQGTVKIDLIKNVSISFSNGEVDVIENNPAYSFTIKFVGTKGIPPNLDDLKTAIEEIKPAHLAVEYSFVYNTNQYLSQFTHTELSDYTHTELREVI